MLAEKLRKVTNAGRPVWRKPSGEEYSEVGATVPTDSGMWRNVPSVDEQGVISTNEDVLRYITVDPITGRILPEYKDLDTAIEASKMRSRALRSPLL